MNSGMLIIIVNFKNWCDTIKCLSSLRTTCYKNFDVLVIDNASVNGSVENITRWMNEYNESGLVTNPIVYQNPKIKYVNFINKKYKFYELQDNCGFAGANNLGIDYAIARGYDYILLLNNDTAVRSDSFEPLLELAGSDRHIGIIGGKALSFDTNYVVGAGGNINWIKGCGKDIIKSRYQNRVCEVDFVSGCHMFIRCELVRSIGLMDERYFLYYEDSDYCLRARRAGWKVMYQPQSILWHRVSASIGTNSASKYLAITRARILFNKTHNKIYFIFCIYLTLLQTGRFIRWFLCGKWAYAKVALQAQLYFFDVHKVRSIK